MTSDSARLAPIRKIARGTACETTRKAGRASAPRRVLDFEAETAAGALTGVRVCGVDEVGRGPLAGPVVAAALICDFHALPRVLRMAVADSKVLSHSERLEIAAMLEEQAALGHVEMTIGHASVPEIDTWNILRASHLAMARAVERLKAAPQHVLVDGNQIPAMPCPAQCVIGGDGSVFSIAAASIVAKVGRDRLMDELALRHSGYGWERNRGYGTAEHRAALARLGPCEQHRRSFRPVQEALKSVRKPSQKTLKNVS